MSDAIDLDLGKWCVPVRGSVGIFLLFVVLVEVTCFPRISTFSRIYSFHKMEYAKLL